MLRERVPLDGANTHRPYGKVRNDRRYDRSVPVYSADWVLPVDGAPIAEGSVAVEDGRIAALGPRREIGPGERFDGAAILPGFVNAHSHLEYAVYAGFGDGLPFDEWLALHVQRKARIGVDEMSAIARLGAAECLRSGTTTVGDASYSAAAASACSELGLRAIVYVEVFGAGTDHIRERFEAQRDRVASSLSELVQIGVSPHTPYTASLELWQAALALGVPAMTHFAETELEVEWTRTGRGPVSGVTPTSIRELAEHGLLVDRLVAAHCVHVDPEEIALLSEHDVAVAHCPRSNALLGCGIAPLRPLLDAGLRVGLGTDSPASAPSFDMFDELRACLMSARLRERGPAAISARDALELATLGSARALGLDEETGSLAAGKRADLTVVSLRGSPYLPWEDPAGAVVLGGSPSRVLLTVVDGTERYRKGSTEWPELTAEAHGARSRLLASAPAAERAP
jgi:5-methylthioadenosine/S-adenosylhomocysteine deaminase